MREGGRRPPCFVLILFASQWKTSSLDLVYAMHFHHCFGVVGSEDPFVLRFHFGRRKFCACKHLHSSTFVSTASSSFTHHQSSVFSSCVELGAGGPNFFFCSCCFDFSLGCPRFWCTQGSSASANFLPVVFGLCTKIWFRLSFSLSK
jgi:hypothetical protein